MTSAITDVSRAVHMLGTEATEAYEGARRKLAAHLNVRANELVLTSGTTFAINLVAYSWALPRLQPGDAILVTRMEHHANIVPWQIIAERQGATIKYIPVTDDGLLDLESYARLLESGRVKLVGVSHVSNVLGTINPVGEIIEQAHAAGALALVDAAQSAPHFHLDVRGLDADFVAFSGHKMLGPTGIGVLYGKHAALEAMPPFLGGGSMIRNVTFEGTTFADLPQKFEAGTPAIAQAIGLGAAIDYLLAIGLDAIHSHELALTQYAMEHLSQIPGLTIFGPDAAHRVGVISFTMKGVHPHDIAQWLDTAGIAVRAGHHCAQPLHNKFGLPATARASFYLYNTLDEVDRLVDSLNKARGIFTRRG